MAENLHRRKHGHVVSISVRSEHKSEPSGGRRRETHRANQIGCCQPKASTRSTRAILNLYTALRRQKTVRARDGEREQQEPNLQATGIGLSFADLHIFGLSTYRTVWRLHVATSENPGSVHRAETNDTTSFGLIVTQCS